MFGQPYAEREFETWRDQAVERAPGGKPVRVHADDLAEDAGAGSELRLRRAQLRAGSGQAGVGLRRHPSGSARRA